MTKQHRSSPLASIHAFMGAFAEAGIIDKRIMRDFDERCLTVVERAALPLLTGSDKTGLQTIA